jgi:cyanophycin synthetase
MKVIQVHALNGPNYWSSFRHQLIVMKIDLEELEHLPTNKINGFYERISEMIPSIYSHRCSEDHEGGFLKRVKEGTWMGHVIEHLALEIQTLAGMDCGFGRTRGTGKPGEYNVIFSYELERAGKFAGQSAVKMAEALVSGEPFDLQRVINRLARIKSEDELGPSTMAIVSEAIKRNIPYTRLNNYSSHIIFGQGVNQKTIRATMTSNTSSMGVEIACDKEQTKQMLSRAYIPVPAGEEISSVEDLQEVVTELGFPLVIKPVDGNHGRGITTNIQTMEAALAGYELARKVSKKIIVERFIEGFDFRFLVVNYKLVAVAKRTPAMIMGDGFSTIQQLIDEVNTDPRRGEGHEKVLTAIKIDAVTNAILAKNELTLESVLPCGKMLVVKDTANISTGGTAEDITDFVHPANVQMAERIAKIMNLDVCGIDVMTNDVTQPITPQTGAVLEVNACPGFRMHTHPSNGLGRNVGEAVMRMLYPDGNTGRIPVIAVTGTNGKTTTTRLVSHFARTSGYNVGFTTTDGIYINNTCIHEGDCTGPSSSRTILQDPTVNFAVLECARGGILRAGLGFDQCDISIITNITEDHLGLNDIHTLEEMARVKCVVADSTRQSGYAILNADDDLVYDLHEELDCNIALFSTRATNSRVRKHCEAGGIAAVIDKGFLTICKGQWKVRVSKISDIPLAMEGKASSMIKNILPATLAAVLSNISIDAIRIALRSFVPSPEFTPGRMNVFHFNDFDFMVDYAHNSAGFEELKRFVSAQKATTKVGIVAAVGDRRDEDIKNVGVYAARIFDEIIIRHDEDLRGRSIEEINKLIVEGIMETDPSKPFRIISSEEEAINFAMSNAVKGSFICVCTEKVQKTIKDVSFALANEIHSRKNYVLSKAS